MLPSNTSDRIRPSRRWLLPALLALWVFVPELRRLADWQIGFRSIPIINIIPLLALVPLVGQLFRKRERPIPLGLLITLWAWTIGFGFALIIAVLAGQSLAAIYELGLFALPVFACFWMLAREDAPQAFSDLSASLAVLGAIVAAYGVYQYLSPPPWDVLWVIASGLQSIGTPEPFGLRIFSTLNSYQLCADFLGLALIAQLPYLRGRSLLWRLPASLLMLTGLALTFDRATWIATAVGMFAYLVLSPRRGAVLGGVLAIAVLAVATFTAGPFLFGSNQAFDMISTRVQTLGDLDTDSSVTARQEETRTALRETQDEPLGQGIGSLGTAAKLGQAQETVTLDGGYLQRLVEMGVFGFAAYVFALLAALGVGLFAWWTAVRAKRERDGAIAAACVAVQIALAVLDVTSDHHNALPGLFFWIVIAISVRLLPAQRSTPFSTQPLPNTLATAS